MSSLIFSGDSVARICLAMQKTRARFLGQDDPWRRKWQLISIFSPGKFQGQRNLVDYSSWGCKETVFLTYLEKNQSVYFCAFLHMLLERKPHFYTPLFIRQYYHWYAISMLYYTLENQVILLMSEYTTLNHALLDKILRMNDFSKKKIALS